MPQIKAYNIVEGANAVILEGRVNDLLDTGWVPLGGLTVVVVDAQKQYYSYLQTMVIYHDA